MSLVERITLRVALCNQPSTPLSADDVAAILDLPIDEVHRAHLPVAQLAPWSTWLEALGITGDGEEGPITTWRAVAAVLDLDEDTVKKHRDRHGDKTASPWFDDAQVVREWWRELHAPKVTRGRPPRPAPKRAVDDTPLDPRALLRELTATKRK